MGTIWEGEGELIITVPGSLLVVKGRFVIMDRFGRRAIQGRVDLARHPRDLLRGGNLKVGPVDLGVLALQVIFGGVFAIVVVKGLIGGLGQNIFNPALAARAFLVLLWPSWMVRYAPAGTKPEVF